MKIEFLQTSYDRYNSGSGSGAGKRRDGGLFWWTMIITVLIGLCCFSWFFSIYVFSHPEKPFNYNLLTKLGKLEPVERFTENNAPAGAAGFLAPKAAYARFAPGPGRLGKAQLEVTNDLLKRQYLLNYKEEKPVYVSGHFRIDQIHPLEAGDPIGTGIVLRGTAIDYTALDFEYIVPTKSAVDVSPFKVGDVIELTGPKHYASVVHVSHLPEERVALSLISLTYPTLGETGQKTVKGGQQAPLPRIAQAPPALLDLSAAWPLTSEGRADAVPHPEVTEDPAKTVEKAEVVAVSE